MRRLKEEIESEDGWKWVFCCWPRVLRNASRKKLFIWLEWIEQSANVRKSDGSWLMVEGVWHDEKWYSKEYRYEFNE